MDFQGILLNIFHFLSIGLVLKLSNLIVPSSLSYYYVTAGCILLWLIISYGTLPYVKKYFEEKVSPENKAVFITGCDSGFGHELAKRLDAKGYVVFASCLFPLADGATNLQKSCSKRLHVLGLDVTKDESVKDAFAYVKENLQNSKLWAVVNNAGIYRGLNTEISTMEEYHQVMEVNAFGMIRVSKIFLPLLRQSKGRLVNLTSLVGRFAFPDCMPYVISKFAAVGFTDTIRIEAIPWGITVISVEPEFFKTNLFTYSQMSKMLDSSLANLDTDLAAFYDEDYKKNIDSLFRFVYNNSSSNTEVVLDDLEASITSKRPLIIYKPCRNMFMSIIRFVAEKLPLNLLNFFIRIVMFILSYPFPKNNS